MAKKLLVIDDQTGITKVVELIARQLGLNARTLNSSSQATEVFIAFKPDVLMLDMIMPEKDGIDVLNEILLTGISGEGRPHLRIQRFLSAPGRGRGEVPRQPERFDPAQAVPPRGTDDAADGPDRGLIRRSPAVTTPHRAAHALPLDRRSCAGWCAPSGRASTSSAIRSSCSGFTPTSRSVPGRPRLATSSATASPAFSPGRPSASLTQAWRSALTGSLKRSTGGSITQEV